jgi:hypothetical protein
MHKILVKDGQIRFVYSDELKSLLEEGKAGAPKRVSHVEPSIKDGKVSWTADLTIVSPGLILGPFNSRREALAAEVKWINKHLGEINVK